MKLQQIDGIHRLVKIRFTEVKKGCDTKENQAWDQLTLSANKLLYDP